jgi:hypothetical protein
MDHKAFRRTAETAQAESITVIENTVEKMADDFA